MENNNEEKNKGFLGKKIDAAKEKFGEKITKWEGAKKKDVLIKEVEREFEDLGEEFTIVEKNIGQKFLVIPIAKKKFFDVDLVRGVARAHMDLKAVENIDYIVARDGRKYFFGDRYEKVEFKSSNPENQESITLVVVQLKKDRNN